MERQAALGTLPDGLRWRYLRRLLKQSAKLRARSIRPLTVEVSLTNQPRYRREALYTRTPPGEDAPILLSQPVHRLGARLPKNEWHER